MKTIKIWMISLLIMVGLTSVASAGINTFFSTANYDRIIVEANETLAITITLRDEVLSPVTDADPQLEFKKSSGDIATELNIVSTEQDGNIYKFFVKTTNAETDEAITITPYGNYDGADWTLGSKVITFKKTGSPEVGAIDPDNSSIVADREQVIADGVDSATITVTLHDEENNPIKNATIVPNQSYSGSVTESIIGAVVNHNNGTYTFNVRSNTVELVTYSVVATATYGNGQTSTKTIVQQDNEATVSFVSRVLPDGMRAEGTAIHITSINDSDYKPYAKPTTPASLGAQAADYSADALIRELTPINAYFGLHVEIPCSGSGYLPSYKAVKHVGAEYSEFGEATRLVLEYGAQYCTNGMIDARVHTVSGIFTPKGLDINKGIGNGTDRVLVDSASARYKAVYGVLLAQFDIATSSIEGDYGELQLRAIAGVVDQQFNQNDTHKFLYLPTNKSGKTWLNNNLGADYANLKSANFDITKQALYPKDAYAYGSFFSASSGNVCPVGYGLPTRSDLNTEKYSWNNTTKYGAIASTLKLSLAGHWERKVHQKAPRKRRYCSDNEKFRPTPKVWRKKGCDKDRKIVAYYLGEGRSSLAFNVFGSGVESAQNSLEYSVRCIKK